MYPLSKNWTTSSLHEGRFTAACGVHIYRGNLLPKEFQGAAFTCEPTGNLVHMEVLAAQGARTLWHSEFNPGVAVEGLVQVIEQITAPAQTPVSATS